MKTTLSVLLAGLTVSALHAQDEAYYEPAPAAAVIYQAPVIYQVPVVYQAAVVYQAGVTFQGPVQCEQPAVAVYPATPNVVYVAGPDSCGPNYYNNARYCSPNVIYFGRGESYLRGYHFRSCR
jgi:hypothetical protein